MGNKDEGEGGKGVPKRPGKDARRTRKARPQPDEKNTAKDGRANLKVGRKRTESARGKQTPEKRTKGSLNAVQGGKRGRRPSGVGGYRVTAGVWNPDQKGFCGVSKTISYTPRYPDLKIQRELIHLHVLVGGSAQLNDVGGTGTYAPLWFCKVLYVK